MLVLNPYPQTPFPGKGAILLGLPPLDPVGGFAPATPFLNKQEVFRQSDRSIYPILRLFDMLILLTLPVQVLLTGIQYALILFPVQLVHSVLVA